MSAAYNVARGFRLTHSFYGIKNRWSTNSTVSGYDVQP